MREAAGGTGAWVGHRDLHSTGEHHGQVQEGLAQPHALHSPPRGTCFAFNTVKRKKKTNKNKTEKQKMGEERGEEGKKTNSKNLL